MVRQFSVAKFGGTSVGDIFSIQKCIDILNKNKDIKIVVVSAQTGVTNLLERLIMSDMDSYKNLFGELHKIIDPIVDFCGNAKELGISVLFSKLDSSCQMLYRDNKLNYKLSAQILSFGEQVSARLFNKMLNNSGIDSKYFDARGIIKTDSCYKKAKPILNDVGDAASKYLLGSEKVIILEGFVGSDKNNDTTVLGRGGSDYSAALIAEAVKADLLYIWTDVVGIHQADPRLIPRSKVIKRINYDEALELTKFGAKVLHPSTLWPVMRSDIKVFVGSTFLPHKGGTYITNGPKNKKTKIRAIAERKSQSLIKVKFSNSEPPNIPYSIFLILQKHGIGADIINLTETSFSFIISQSEDFIEQLIQDLKNLVGVTLFIEQDLSLTAVVGNSLDKIPRLLNKILKVANISNIKLSGYGANGNSLYMLTDGKKNVQKVYKALF